MRLCLSCVAAFGLWLAVSGAHAQQGQVKADSGGIAIGGSVSHSTINIGAYRERTSPLVAIGGSVSHSTINIGLSQEKVEELVRDSKRPLEELTAQQRENIALLKEKLDLSEGQVRRALDIIGEAN